MYCEFDYCIYNKDYKCILDEIEINTVGMCASCIVISLDWDFLESEKERQLKEIEDRWTNKKDE